MAAPGQLVVYDFGRPHSVPVRRHWTEERVAAELAGFLDDLRATSWPTYREFRTAGLGALRKAIDDFGGPEAWAATVGLPINPSSRRPDWDDRRIAQELDAYLARRGATRWPRNAEFVGDGHGPLLRAIARAGGRARWLPPRRDQLLERRLRQLLAGRDEWPTTAEWQQLGELALLVALHRHPLGTAGWAERIELPHPRARPRRGPFACDSTPADGTPTRDGATDGAHAPQQTRLTPPAARVGTTVLLGRGVVAGEPGTTPATSSRVSGNDPLHSMYQT